MCGNKERFHLEILRKSWVLNGRLRNRFFKLICAGKDCRETSKTQLTKLLLLACKAFTSNKVLRSSGPIRFSYSHCEDFIPGYLA
ncbi:hypothetical protein TNIN_125451 [Trichonephila inaurata madagascariensis]|uniref:Uncharacterized protein n=1 Tax=Trichonephila inaurata madagascariensis TaxID=2747483 RepID=A0A8X7C692_9ARAC|nr:hypothetical protein TNIN_125451 [Trichonephila inaurata madagascariensis]